jgi:hypothetical protein
MPESPERKWNRVQKKIQQSILTSYPNPNRDGCPGGQALHDLARRAAAIGNLEGDEQWEHVTHCSPCYREYLDAREQLRKKKESKQRNADKK